MTRSTRLPASIIIVSHGRPSGLSLCLTAVSGLLYHPFEVIVVACPEGCDAARSHALGPHLTIVPAPGRNIAASRNAGLSRAGGAAIAFLDDDAIPYPCWLDHLLFPIASGQADLAGGYVVGRNGFDLQWGTRMVDAMARHWRIETREPEAFVPDLAEGIALRTEGTNMAARREALALLGGFDTGFRFYMDDTDLNMRARRAGLRTASVPQAKVWHRQLPSPRRGTDRVPRDLTDIGRSLARFLERHADPATHYAAHGYHRDMERRRALFHMVRGTLRPEEVGPLLRSFDGGLAERTDGAADWDGSSPDKIRAIREGPPETATRFRADVRPGFRAHRLVFGEPGVWLRLGGRFGRRRVAELPQFLQGLSSPATPSRDSVSQL